MKLYGKIPSRCALLNERLSDRKYFDSGDYALSKAGRADYISAVGRQHPYPEAIPHHINTSPPQSPQRLSASPRRHSTLK